MMPKTVNLDEFAHPARTVGVGDLVPEPFAFGAGRPKQEKPRGYNPGDLNQLNDLYKKGLISEADAARLYNEIIGSGKPVKAEESKDVGIKATAILVAARDGVMSNAAGYAGGDPAGEANSGDGKPGAGPPKNKPGIPEKRLAAAVSWVLNSDEGKARYSYYYSQAKALGISPEDVPRYREEAGRLAMSLSAMIAEEMAAKKKSEEEGRLDAERMRGGDSHARAGDAGRSMVADEFVDKLGLPREEAEELIASLRDSPEMRRLMAESPGARPDQALIMAVAYTVARRQGKEVDTEGAAGAGARIT
jgi:hypothetical protein